MKTQLKIRTEFSFRTAYGPIEKVVDRLKETGCEAAAITDRSSTFGHVQFNRYCKRAGIKPLFGVELAFIEDATLKEKRQRLYWMSIIARNNSGLREIYSTVEEASNNFHYVPRLSFSKLQDFSQDLIILSGNTGLGQGSSLSPTVYREGHPATSQLILANNNIVPVSDNYMIVPDNRAAYQILTGRNSMDRPSAMHILDEWSLRSDFEILEDKHFDLADKLAEECNAEIVPASNIKYQSNISLYDMCLLGAARRKCELNETYMARMTRELDMIKEKGFEDYFFVIADMIDYAKKHMLVGPARGSSCGSLVCYLTGITDIDPIPHGLIFERFIDVTRHDLPDIDIDFQDNKREMVFEYVREKYGSENVARLGTISRYKAKSAINETAKAYNIPVQETKSLTDSILKRSSGDSRASFCILDTFSDIDAGKIFITKYPQMAISAQLENHARHTGMHAAGVIITNEPIRNYVAKDNRNNTVHIDKYDAENINLMKIDALGLKTLAIIADCLEDIGWTHEAILNHPLDDAEAFQVLRDGRFCGIFQFEGQALQSIARRVHVDRFEDISALTALARPGPFASGATSTWIKRRAGKEPTQYFHERLAEITSETYGLIIYQEQVMNVVRNVGLLSWEDTSTLRKAMSSSKGIEYFNQFWLRFREGAISQGFTEESALEIWNNVNTLGSWAFNKSHAVAYGMLSYWCCVLKAHFPVQFALSTLRNTLDDDAIKRYLRELDRSGFKFTPVDLEKSEVSWSYKDETFLGGLTNIKGVGLKTANRILLARAQGVTSILKTLQTPYDNVFEGRERFADLFAEPQKFNIFSKITPIIDVTEDDRGMRVFVAKIIHRNERSLNETMFLAQRNNVRIPNDKWLNVILEDDTSTIMGIVSRFKYPSMGVKLINDYTNGDWFIWKGQLTEGRRMFIEKFKLIGRASGSVGEGKN